MAVDCDLDGNLDMIIANSNTRDQIWLNDGHGQFSRIINIPQQSGSTTVVMGDFDDDGDLDAFFGRYGRREVVWLNTSVVASE